MGLLRRQKPSIAVMTALNNRLRQMAELDQKLEELEGFNDDILNYGETTEELDAGDEDDEDYLMNLERLRQEKEYESLKGSIYEPSLIICWVVVSLVTAYVILLIVTGDPESQAVRDEL